LYTEEPSAWQAWYGSIRDTVMSAIPDIEGVSSLGADARRSDGRPLRADARRNYHQLIAAADAEFSDHGASASLEDIARRAGVGIGTLYRHFPSRDDLIANVLSESTAAIVARGHELLDAPSPSAALAQWLRELVTYVTTYRGLTAALATSYVGSGTELCSNCELITRTGGRLLARAQAAREIRRDADVREVILTAHSAAWVAEQTKDPAATDRLLGILFDGLRAIPADAGKRLSRERKSAGAKPGRAKPGRAKPGRAKPGRAKPGRAKPGRAKPGRTKPGRAKRR
jgi:AcrR family transcriptional regulator